MPRNSGLINERERAICGRLKLYRERIEWPQPAFAKELGISRDKLASIEYGRTPLRYHLAYVLCSIFDLNPLWLVSGDGRVTGGNATIVLVWPKNVPEQALFSQVVDKAWQAYFKMAAGAEADYVRLSPKPGEERPNLDFDHVTALLQIVIDRTKDDNFSGPIERAMFAIEARRFLEELAFKYGRKRVGRALAKRGKSKGVKVSDDAERDSRQKKMLTDTSNVPITKSMKPQLPGLLKRLRAVTHERGKASALASWLDIPRETVSRYLSGKIEPGGEMTLKLLQWVEEQERK